jgi:hypothetical protein
VNTELTREHGKEGGGQCKDECIMCGSCGVQVKAKVGFVGMQVNACLCENGREHGRGLWNEAMPLTSQQARAIHGKDMEGIAKDQRYHLRHLRWSCNNKCGKVQQVIDRHCRRKKRLGGGAGGGHARQGEKLIKGHAATTRAAVRSGV